MNNKNILLHLSLIDGVSAATIAMVLNNKPNALDLCDMYNMSQKDLMHLFGLSQTSATTLTTGLTDTKSLANELALIDKYNIQWATTICPMYPALLKNIHMMPPVIYWQGATPNNEKSVAFVGSRKANSYAQTVISTLVPPLVNYGYTIVSGGALGADAMAHQAALQAGGKTVVVLGSGVLRPLPHTNKKLFENIIMNGGTILSAFPAQTEALPYNFPERNRIISGLSRGTVVVQAAAKSGTSITARFALDQGRDVFAVPGSIYDELSVGCHALIAQGAKITTHAHDILREFGEVVPEEKKSEPHSNTRSAAKSKTNTDSHLQTPVFEAPAPDNSPKGIVLQACAQPSSVDDLIDKTGLDVFKLNELLFDLRIEGKINQSFTGMWSI